MLRYLIRRLLLTIPVLLGVATLVFSLIHFIPGDPAQAMLGEGAAPEDVAQLRARLGLDRPLLVQSVRFLRGWCGAISAYRCVTISRYRRNPGTGAGHRRLAFASMAVAMLVALPLGIVGAVWRGTAVDFTAMTISLVGHRDPELLARSDADRVRHRARLAARLGRGTPAHVILPAVTLGSALAASSRA